MTDGSPKARPSMKVLQARTLVLPAQLVGSLTGRGGALPGCSVALGPLQVAQPVSISLGNSTSFMQPCLSESLRSMCCLREFGGEERPRVSNQFQFQGHLGRLSYLLAEFPEAPS